MKNPYSTWITAAFLSAALLLAPVPGEAQLPKDPVERAKVIAQIFQANARQLTLFDREGKEVAASDHGICTTSQCSPQTPNGSP